MPLVSRLFAGRLRDPYNKSDLQMHKTIWQMFRGLQVGLQRVFGAKIARYGNYRKLRRAVIKALGTHFGEVAVCTD